MPSPLGHALAGLTVGWLADRAPQPSGGLLREALSPVALGCAALAVLPDADLIFDWHRSGTHSVTATALIFIVAMVVTGKVTRRPAWRVAMALAAAQSTHLLLDWLAIDSNSPSGIQVLWPFDHRFYVSGLDIFPGTERDLMRPGALMLNARSAMWEVLLMGPVALGAWLVRRGRTHKGRQGRQGRQGR
ncbi:MAG: metal-dependent hydrolase [Vicinamibacterales bacterium]